VRADGVLEAYRQSMSRLESPMPMGYSSAGTVLDVGDGVTGFSVGDVVACAGTGYASHAEIVRVPRNLCVAVPDGVSADTAAFVALGGVALEAVRMARVEFGHRVGVIGLGLLGQLAVQLLCAAGCHVVGMDINPSRCRLAEELGCEVAVSSSEEMCALVTGRWPIGCDAVVLLAATSSNEPISLAADICRERGQVVAAGMVGLDVPRKPFYEKELSLTVSRAWGPGLYDPDFEERDVKYPSAFVRWTAQANMAEFLAQAANGRVVLEPIITHRFPIEKALEAYSLILEGKEPAMGVLLTYPENGASTQVSEATYEPRSASPVVRSDAGMAPGELVGVGLIGAGQYANGTLLPAMKGLSGLRYRGVATAGGLSGHFTKGKFGFEYSATEYRRILEDPDISLVFVLTRHGSHARLVAEALRAGKHVFVEKPLALDVEQLRQVEEAYDEARQSHAVGHGGASDRPLLMAGFNRRFSPTAQWLRKRFAHVDEPLAVHCTVNAGFVPADSWVHDPVQGGGRIVGEVCHFVELIQYLTGSVPVRVYAETIRAAGYQPSDNVVVTLTMANQAMGSIMYVAGGDKSHPRERVEVFGGGAVGVIGNFKTASFSRQGRREQMKHWLSVDRGHRAEVEALVAAIQQGGPAPVAFEEYVLATLATFAIEDSLRRGEPVRVGGLGHG
jgi:polar amino acid transport system substrate-binding protein